MRFKILWLVLVSLSVAANAQAHRFEIGPQFGISVPTGQASDAADLGVNAGVTATFMQNPTSGFGVDLAYHSWPGSSNLNTATDVLFSQLGGTPITGSKWTLSALQVTGHIKVVPQVSGPVAPWFQVGAGVYHAGSNLKVPADQLQAAGFTVSQQSSNSTTDRFGYTGSLGVDFATGNRMKVGLDASYHYLLWKDNTGNNFTVFTVGVHILR